MKKTEFFLSPSWANKFPHVVCGFTLPSLGNQALTRPSVYSGRTTAENRSALAALLSIDEASLFSPHQVHGDTIIDVDETMLGWGAFSKENAVDGDACITQIKELLLITSWADCIPVLLYDDAAGYCGSVHSGWRGTKANIAGKTVRKMLEKGSDITSIYAAIGPGIKGCCYSVGPDFEEFFKEYPSCLTQKNSRLYLDLSKVVYLELLKEGLPEENIEMFPHCTSCSSDPVFFSCRKDKDHFEGQAAFIAVRKSAK